MKKQLLVVSVFGVASILSCSSDPVDCVEARTCGAPGDDGGPSTPDGGNGGTVVPPGCDPAADPKDAPKCVVNEYAVFVDGSGGSDGNTGTKELPVRSIGAALGKLGGKPRIYVCEGTYAEAVKLTRGVSVFGGFSCGRWEYSGGKTKIAPGAAGKEALVVENVAASVVIADVELEAAAGDATAKNSIALRIVKATDVKLVRVKATAGAGFNGEDGAAGTTGTLTAVSSGPMSLAGNAANGTTPGALKTCTCSTGGTSSGGGGGAPGGNGQDGAPNLAGAAPKDGRGGTGNVADCNPAGFGRSGADALRATDAQAATQSGAVEDGTWHGAGPRHGADASAGQGGGGGGGQSSASAGGGGGCGGCGGSAGKGGHPGGASIAAIVVTSALTLSDCTLTSRVGGNGGRGGAGGAGTSGGPGASGGPTGCQAGGGGRGGDGGAGAGGAGGISVGVLYKGARPTVDAATEAAITVGAPGAKGVGGAPGVNDGPAGIAEKIRDAATL